MNSLFHKLEIDVKFGFEPDIFPSVDGLLFPLSYNYIKNEQFYVENIGVEPMTSCVQGRRSSQLS